MSGAGADGSPDASYEGQAKISFDLAAIDDTGLAGPLDGRVAVAYEFCIPDIAAYLAEVRHIDSTVRVQPGSPGRIGCGPDQVLCIGSTHQPDWRAVLKRLAALEYIARIDRSFAE
jgi:hypothetical protein